jgi:rSAM/selenodomain-associated transferase 1
MVPWLSKAEALRLHVALVQDSVRLLRLAAAESGATPFVSFGEARSRGRRTGLGAVGRAAAGIPRITQRGPDLGARLLGTIGTLRARGFRRVVVIGSDSPTLPPAILLRALAALDEGEEVALGPAEDGGYYLVGTSRVLPAMFEGVPWGTDRVLEVTLQRLDRAGVRAVLLPRWYDVDRPADLERVRRDLADWPTGVPPPVNTHAFVRALEKDGRLPRRGGRPARPSTPPGSDRGGPPSGARGGAPGRGAAGRRGASRRP